MDCGNRDTKCGDGDSCAAVARAVGTDRHLWHLFPVNLRALTRGQCWGADLVIIILSALTINLKRSPFKWDDPVKWEYYFTSVLWCVMRDRVSDTSHSHSSLNRQSLNPPHLRLSLMLRMSKCQFHFILWEWELCCAVAYHIYWKPTLQLWIASLGWLADTLNSLSHDMKTLSETQAPLNRNVWLRNFEWAECQAKICRPYKITLVLIFQGLGICLVNKSC